MSENTNNEETAWPIPKSRFEVDLGPELKSLTFQKVSGMNVETQLIEYRKSNSPLFAIHKMPEIEKNGNITMNRGVFVNDSTFWDWHEQISMNTIERRTVIVKLLDENGAVTMQWQLDIAWPTKITMANIDSDGNEVAVESLEIAHEQLTITNGQ